jgi:hypothetical protein
MTNGITTTGYGQSSSANTNSSGTSAQQNAYTPGQQSTQATLPGLYSQLLSQLQGSAAGNTPSNFTNNPELVGAYENAYNKNVAPQEAFQGGAGSPAIASNNALGLQQLLANQYNTGIQQSQNANSLLAGGIGSAANYALGFPTGSNAQSQNQGTAKTTQAGLENSTTFNPLANMGVAPTLPGGP